ncbi:multiple C2 domain and transmembrane region protein 14 [Cicer arietinum]|uniref:FT-interacting protein 7 n=1 Tax=Cicer arietinum TaxID=3827 RepID=A0A1S2XKI8_CICAR|nr:FT-interacting protein 7 [Cicer arietinum]
MSFIRKLIVEVVNAKNLMPKDGQGTASAYAIVDFDGERKRTTTKLRDLNPEWNEKLEFLLLNKESMVSEMLEVNLYNDKKSGKRNTFLGKVKISGSTVVKSGEEVVVYYPLEKRSVFSQIRGELGLKVCYVDLAVTVTETAGDGDEKKEDKAEEKLLETGQDGDKKEENVKEEEKKEQEKEPKEEENQKPTEETPATGPSPAPTPEVENPPIAETEKVKLKENQFEIIQKSANLNVSNHDLRSLSNDRSRSAYDLVDMMQFVYVRVVKAKIAKSGNLSTVFSKLVIGTHSVKTKNEKEGKDWDQVFAFDKEGLNSTSLEVSVWSEENKEGGQKTELCLGTVSFDLQEVPKRVPPDSPLAPQWYTLESETSPGNDVMVAVWIGTQADETFQESWQSDSGGLIPETRSKVYLSPKLWYLRLTVIQTQDLQIGSCSEARCPELYVKAQLGLQTFRTGRSVLLGSANPTWNEDLVFVVSEPFEPILVLTVEDASNSKSIGKTKIHVSSIERRLDDRTEAKSRWFNLSTEEKNGADSSSSYTGRMHVRVCLEGGYHVIDEAAHVTSDVRASAKQLTKPPIGLLEVGIRGATNLLPVKTKDGTRGTTDAYVVAKYGPKWIRTRTIVDRFNPRWNEQYTWDVYDPCTVLTIGVFDNGRYGNNNHRDVRIGKIRVRLSTLETNRVYVNSYSLIVLLPGGAKRMGEIEIAVRFSCSSWLSLMQAYTSPILPRMHYVRPFGPAQQDVLRQTAMKIVTARLARSEPPLGHEVVQFMLDSDTHMWSMRRSKANWFRLMGFLSRATSVFRWLDGISTWIHPPTTVLVHALLIAIVFCPYLILPTIFMYSFLILLLRFRNRPRVPQNMDPRMSYVDMVNLDELDEEFDGFPTTRSSEVVRMRYDRVRALAGRAQTLLGDVATQGERLEALFSWRDPRATGIFALMCLVASLVFYAMPFRVFVLFGGFYYMRHPKFRNDMPSISANFYRRLPSFSDQIM